jgi:GT2 family glycosyltransferase
MMIQKKLFESLDGFDENFPFPHMEDVDLRERVRLKNEKILFVKDAVVDHPPKRLPSGNQLGKYHESDIYYSLCKKKIPISLYVMMNDIITYRFGVLKNSHLGVDTVKACFSLILEITYVVANYSNWCTKYQGFGNLK